MNLEIACFSFESALIAAEAGADRIELCAGFEVGGTTPDFETLRKLKSEITIPVYVMIRPRGGNFVYTDTEFGQMRSDILRFDSLADGFVFGILDAHSKVDIALNSELVKLAGKPCTFHRAFDETDFNRALEDVVLCGFSNILTSAGSGNAIDNFERLEQLVRRSASKITIMPGGGVRSSNIEKLRTSGAEWFHSAAITHGSRSADAKEIRKLKGPLYAEDIKRRLVSDFGAHQHTARILLDEAVQTHDYLNSGRILRCIVFLAEGNLQMLERAIQNAIADPRDVMLWAEYDNIGNVPTRVRDFDRNFEDSEIG